jgi:hypothetical protein
LFNEVFDLKPTSDNLGDMSRALLKVRDLLAGHVTLQLAGTKAGTFVHLFAVQNG